ncbi:MAG: type I methionyl aminopeptidase [Candidatus Doudnabacteria bacterium]|nr:type I methionyl aminopeptidase [Candidatus Doudnabacteria bacterium]
MIIENPEQLDKLRKSGKILAETLALVSEKVAPGVSAQALDQIAEENIRKSGGIPAFKNYRSRKGDPSFPASLCVSINDEVVHGIPSRDKILSEGDIVGLDLGVNYQGLFTDAAITVPVGKIEKKLESLLETTQKALENALSAIKPGATTGDLGHAMETTAKLSGFQVVRELVGHGVGLSVHEDPEIPCFGKPGSGSKLQEGMVIAVEPMINEFGWEVVFADDKWTVLTMDAGRSAHFEQTLLVTKDGCEIITQV